MHVWLIARAFDYWFVLAEDRNPGRDAPLFEKGVVEAVGVARIGQHLRQLLLLRQTCLQLRDEPGQVNAVAATG
ncbi:hypothetical protein [Hymenobacter bucti]|uniref:Uncharacterized protein n=1 Tax=Hymenobacter bucti TaxID=1844114 RepID=A0ABW4QZB9_9BACT